MPFSALLLVLLAALFHATWNLVAKKSGGTTVFAFSTCLLTAIIWFPFALGVIIYYPHLSFFHWDSWAWLMVSLSAAIHAVYYIVLLHGYKVAPLSIVYPIARGTGPLISSIGAILLFQESITLSTVMGVLLIVLGIVLLTWNGGAKVEDSEAFYKGLGWGAVTGLTISIYTLVDACGVKTLGMNPLLFDYWGGVFRAFIFLPFVFNKKNEVVEVFKSSFKGMLVIAILGPLAYILVLSAIQLAPVSHVAPAREVSMLFGAFFGGKILNEGRFTQRMLAAGLIAGGVILLVV